MVTEDHIHDPCGGHPSLDFTNSIGRSPGLTENERLVDYPALVGWSVQAGTLPAGRGAELRAAAASDEAAAAAVVVRALALREAIFEVWHADIHGQAIPEAPLATLNRELEIAHSHLRIAPAGPGFSWTWAPAPLDLDAPLWPIARAAADLLASPERELVRECAAPTCLWLFLDRSRNRRRRWCDMKSCGNREKVREHRRRRRSQGERP